MSPSSASPSPTNYCLLINQRPTLPGPVSFFVRLVSFRLFRAWNRNSWRKLTIISQPLGGGGSPSALRDSATRTSLRAYGCFAPPFVSNPNPLRGNPPASMDFAIQKNVISLLKTKRIKYAIFHHYINGNRRNIRPGLFEKRERRRRVYPRSQVWGRVCTIHYSGNHHYCSNLPFRFRGLLMKWQKDISISINTR